MRCHTIRSYAASELFTLKLGRCPRISLERWPFHYFPPNSGITFFTSFTRLLAPLFSLSSLLYMCLSECWHPAQIALLRLGKQLSKRCGGYLDQLLIWLRLEMVLFSSFGCNWMTFISTIIFDDGYFVALLCVECAIVVSWECRFPTPPQIKKCYY